VFLSAIKWNTTELAQHKHKVIIAPKMIRGCFTKPKELHWSAASALKRDAINQSSQRNDAQRVVM